MLLCILSSYLSPFLSLLIYLPTCLSLRSLLVHPWLSICSPVCLLALLYPSLSICLPVALPLYILIPANFPSHSPAVPPLCMFFSLPTYLPAYLSLHSYACSAITSSSFSPQGLSEAGSDLEAVNKYLDQAGSKLKYRTYGETLFDILIAGGILSKCRHPAPCYPAPATREISGCDGGQCQGCGCIAITLNHF